MKEGEKMKKERRKPHTFVGGYAERGTGMNLTTKIVLLLAVVVVLVMGTLLIRVLFV